MYKRFIIEASFKGIKYFLIILNIAIYKYELINSSSGLVSNDFTNLNLIQRHQLIYKILKDMIKTEIHALSMKLLDIEEYNKN